MQRVTEIIHPWQQHYKRQQCLDLLSEAYSEPAAKHLR